MRPAYGGIDFGTSNSTVGVIENGKPRLVPLEDDNLTLPSAVFFNYEDNGTYLGRSAIGQYTDGIEGRLMRALKSVLGSSLVHEKTRLKSRSVAFTDIIGIFLGHLKTRLESHVGTSVDTVVLGRPVQFVDDDAERRRRRAGPAREGGARAGFQAHRLPVRADRRGARLRAEGDARGTGADRRHGRRHLGLLDRQGFATSAPPQADRTDDILANRGIHIGGTDFDRLLSLAHVMPELGYLTPTKDGKRNLPAGYFVDLATWQRINLLYTRKAKTDLRQMRFEAARPDLVDG